MDRWGASPFGPPINVRRGGLWAKHMGLKSRAIGNTHGNTLVTWGTTWRNGRNTSATPGKNK